MNYYLDTEFNGFNGTLISLGIVSEKGKCIYLVNKSHPNWNINEWVKENVLPLINYVPIGVVPQVIEFNEFPSHLDSYFTDDTDIRVHSDWPDDIKYLCKCLITGPGTMIKIPNIAFHVHRVEAHPNDIQGCQQHNAIWDAIALRYVLTGKKEVIT